MSRTYEAASSEAWDILTSCIASIESQIVAGEIKDEEDLHDAIHTAVDGSLIYTWTHYVCVFGLKDEEDAIEGGLCEPTNFGQALAAQAFCNLRSAVGAHDFSDALQVAEDKRLETEGA